MRCLIRSPFVLICLSQVVVDNFEVDAILDFGVLLRFAEEVLTQKLISHWLNNNRLWALSLGDFLFHLVNAVWEHCLYKFDDIVCQLED